MQFDQGVGVPAATFNADRTLHQGIEAGLELAVADWARRPSRPVPDEVRADLRAAWEDDLDTAGVLGALRAAEADPGLVDGARFETYAYADRLLGLDLARDLGNPA